MSQSQSLLGELILDIGPYGSSEGSFQLLSELADRAFALAEQHAGLDVSADIPLSVKSRFANIIYSIESSIPISAFLYQSAPAMHAQQVVIDFEMRTAECEGQFDLSIEPEQIELVQDEIKPYLQDMCERNRRKEKERFLKQNIDWRVSF